MCELGWQVFWMTEKRFSTAARSVQAENRRNAQTITSYHQMPMQMVYEVKLLLAQVGEVQVAPDDLAQSDTNGQMT